MSVSRQHRNTEFVNVSLTPEGRDALRRLAIMVSAQTGRRMSLSETLTHIDAGWNRMSKTR